MPRAIVRGFKEGQQPCTCGIRARSPGILLPTGTNSQSPSAQPAIPAYAAGSETSVPRHGNIRLKASNNPSLSRADWSAPRSPSVTCSGSLRCTWRLSLSSRPLQQPRTFHTFSDFSPWRAGMRHMQLGGFSSRSSRATSFAICINAKPTLGYACIVCATV